MKNSILILCLLPAAVKAQSFGNADVQQDPHSAQYFMHEYLGNPAFAGKDTGLTVYAGYQRQWGDVPDAPVSQIVTLTHQIERRIGAGLVVYNDVAGVMKRTRVGVSYAYHIGAHLHMGLTLALDNKRIDVSKVTGDVDDPSVNAFNRRDNFFESDFGVVYTDERYTFQMALPNLVSTFQRRHEETGNMSIYYVAAGYRHLTLNEQVPLVEPKVAVRGVKGYASIFDIGVNVSLMRSFANVFMLYHTSRNFTAGMGFHFTSFADVQLSYTTQTAGLKRNVDGSLDLSVRLRLFK